MGLPESDICTFALTKNHYASKHEFDTNLFSSENRPATLQALYDAATKTPVHLMRQLDRWRHDGHRTSRFFVCTPVLGAKRRKIRSRVDIDIETRMVRVTAVVTAPKSRSSAGWFSLQFDIEETGSKLVKVCVKRAQRLRFLNVEVGSLLPAAVEELRRWTSNEALGDITVTTDCANRIAPNVTMADGDATDGTIVSDDEAIDHKLPSPRGTTSSCRTQVSVIPFDGLLKFIGHKLMVYGVLLFPAEIVAVDISGKSFDRMSVQRRSLLTGDISSRTTDGDSVIPKRRTRRRPRSRRRNTLAGTDQKEIQNALTAGEEHSSPTFNQETESKKGAVSRSKSSDVLRPTAKKESPENKKSHFNTLKQWGKNRYDKIMNRSSETKTENSKPPEDIDDFNVYEVVGTKRTRDLEKERRTHERNSSISSSEKSSINLPVSNTISSVMNIAVKLRESSAQRRQRRSGGSKDEPHSSSGNWSASSESGRASIGSEITTTTHPKSTTSTATSNNSLNQPSSVNSKRRFNINTSASGSVTSEGTLTPDIIHDLHEDGETSSVYSCDTEGYYTSFHMDSGLKTLKEEDTPPTPLHSTSVFSNSGSCNTVLSAENEYELFGKGSTSTTTSSAGTVCTTLRASESNRSLTAGPAVPERKSSLFKSSTASPESSLERDFSDKTGTVKRSPASTKPTVVALIHKECQGDVSPDSGHNTSSSPIESISSPNGVRSVSDFEISESSDMEGPERIERIRVKTTINSSRIPSMCAITPPHSDDESVNSSNSSQKDITNKKEFKSADLDKDNRNLSQRIITTNINGKNKQSLINVNPQTGYATVESIDQPDHVTKTEVKSDINQNTENTITGPKSVRAPSPSGGEYVTIADVRNNNEKVQKPVEVSYANDAVNRNLSTVLADKVRDAEYVCLNELPFNDNNNVNSANLDSLERKRQGARVMLDAEGKVVYSSDSLRRRKGAHTTFEPGPYVKPTGSPAQSPLAVHRTPKAIRPINSTQNQMVALVPPVEFNRPLSPQSDKLVIRASSGISSSTTEIVRMPPSTIVTPTVRSISPKPYASRGAYVHIQDAGRPLSPTQEKGKSQTPAARTPRPHTKNLKTNDKNLKNARAIQRSDSYRIANAPLTLEILNAELEKLDIEDRIEREIENELWRERINYPPTVSPLVSPKLCERQCHIYSQAHAQKILLASPKRVILPMDPAEKRVRVLSASVTDTEICAWFSLQERVPCPAGRLPYPNTTLGNTEFPSGNHGDMYKYRNPVFESHMDNRYMPEQYYLQKGNSMYSTLPSKKTQYFNTEFKTERSVTPDITRGLERNYNFNNEEGKISYYQPRVYNENLNVNYQHSLPRNFYRSDHNLLNQKLGIPVQLPDIGRMNLQRVPSNYVSSSTPTRSRSQNELNTYKYHQSFDDSEGSFKISPIDPRHSGGFQSSTPASKNTELRAAKNLDNKLLSPKKSTMSNEELSAVIHKSKKRMNIETEETPRSSPVTVQNEIPKKQTIKSPESGYLDKSRSRLSWSPSKGEYVDFNPDIDKLSPPNSSRSRQSWACSDRKGPATKQTSNMDFKRLLLQKSTTTTPKMSAVEQLKKSKEHVKSPQSKPPTDNMSILDLSCSPRSLVNRKLLNNVPGSPNRDPKPVPKILSPRSQWRFTRSDVLSSTILEDCREDESPNSSGEKKEPSPKTKNLFNTNFNRNKEQSGDLEHKPYISISQKMQAQRAQFFQPISQTQQSTENVKEKHTKEAPPTLETSF
ncbi:hypothetical protein NQ317_000444 [Molorchus minor]|uniref:Uncharacterized protein n=1 Tax=Molorchus minor TaxID=1323400 RepID=A0ABQ9J5W6_9CUCU|nr:hypothetical protein NQ317_000444 [Molorchus minor]